MPEVALTPKERQALKARAHALKPVVLLGNAGASAAVVREIDRALTAHELIKVRVPGDDRADRDALFADLAETLSAARVQAIGKLLVLYRPFPETDESVDPATARTERKSRSLKPEVPNRLPSGQKPPTRDRREAERVNRPPAARRDPGAAHRARGRTNVARKPGAKAKLGRR